MLVRSEDDWARVSGTSIGGGTFYGLCHLLTGLTDFDDMLTLGEQGNNVNVDLVVGDIYGGDYNKIGLKSSTIASNFGKATLFAQQQEARSAVEGPAHGYNPLGQRADSGSDSDSEDSMSTGSAEPVEAAERRSGSTWQPRSADIARSLLIMISNNIGQVAYLNAVRYNCKRIYFAGTFLRHSNTVAMRRLAYAITFWSKGQTEALFLRHEGYFGALGAFLSTLDSRVDQSKLPTASSPYRSPSQAARTRTWSVGHATTGRSRGAIISQSAEPTRSYRKQSSASQGLPPLRTEEHRYVSQAEAGGSGLSPR